MILLLRFWKPLAGVVLLLAVVLAVLSWKHGYDEARRGEGRAEVQAQFDAYVQAARERSTALALAWDQQRQAAEQAGKDLADERTARAADNAAHLAALPDAVARAPVPAAALDVLDRAVAASNAAAPAGPAVEPDRAAPAASGGAADVDGQLGPLIGWAASVIDLYDQCRARVAGWAAFYAGLQAAQPAE